MDKLFDREMPFEEAGQAIADEDLQGRAVQVCTVRQEEMGDIALGNVFWLLQAAKAQAQGANVTVTDFYDRPDTANTGITDFMKILEMEDVTFERAEDVPRDMDAWQMFCDFVRANADEMETWETIGTIRDGIDKVIASGEGYDVPTEMVRFLEEFSVWVRNIDSGAVQLLNHEREMTGFARRVYPDAKKEFWCVSLPINNEYRGQYNEDGNIRRFRLKDLPQKLALGEQLEGYSAEKAADYALFYKGLLADIVGIIKAKIDAEEAKDMARLGEDYEPDSSYALNSLVAKIADIDYRLIPFFVDEFVDVEQVAEIDLDPYSVDDPMDRGEGPINLYVDGVAMVVEAELASGNPNLDRVRKMIVPYAADSIASGRGYRRPSLDNALLSDDMPIEELTKYWLDFIKCAEWDERRGGDIAIFEHPIARKIAASLGGSDATWEEIKSVYIDHLSGESFPGGKNYDLAVINRIMDELFFEDPEVLYRIAEEKMMNVEQAISRGHVWMVMRYLSKNYLRFLSRLFQKYLESESPRHADEAGKYLEVVNNVLNGNTFEYAPGVLEWGRLFTRGQVVGRFLGVDGRVHEATKVDDDGMQGFYVNGISDGYFNCTVAEMVEQLRERSEITVKEGEAGDFGIDEEQPGEDDVDPFDELYDQYAEYDL